MGQPMREGFWIVAATGEFFLVTEHASWIQNPSNARALGLSEEVIAKLGMIRWDFNGPGRKAILLEAMAHGLIRSRAHGPGQATIEFTVDTEAAIRAVAPFMLKHFGPRTTVKANNLRTGESISFVYGEAKKIIESGDIPSLLPVWKRPTQALPVRRPYVLLKDFDEMPGWTCWELPVHLDPHGLVALLREHVPNGSGWLALTDGRTWKLAPNTPPLTPLDALNPALAGRACPDCGWPTGGRAAPCQCENRSTCRVCSMPIFWPIPGRDFMNLQGDVLHAATFVAYGHRGLCVHWPSVQVLPLDDLIRRGT